MYCPIWNLQVKKGNQWITFLGFPSEAQAVDCLRAHRTLVRGTYRVAYCMRKV